jgi:hypothetical protein
MTLVYAGFTFLTRNPSRKPRRMKEKMIFYPKTGAMEKMENIRLSTSNNRRLHDFIHFYRCLTNCLYLPLYIPVPLSFVISLFFRQTIKEKSVQLFPDKIAKRFFYFFTIINDLRPGARHRNYFFGTVSPSQASIPSTILRTLYPSSCK